MSTPRVVVDALIPDTNRLPGGMVLRSLSIAHMLLLEKINSPFFTAGQAAKRAAKGGLAPELAMLAVVYILTRTETEIDQLFFGFDRPAFDASVWRFAKEQPPALLDGLQAKLKAIIDKGTSTLMGGGSDEEPAQKKTN